MGNTRRYFLPTAACLIGVGMADATAGTLTWIDVPAQGQASAQVSFVPVARGLHGLPALSIETRFPLGLFRAWSVWRPAATVLVYPAPEQPAPPLPAGQPTGGQELPARQGSSGEFDGLRGWRRGDSLRQVVWKKVARTGELVSRDSASTAAQSLVLDLAQAGVPDAESRLKRLAAWVLSAERLGLNYALHLPGVDLPSAGGEAQRRSALEALALWQAGGHRQPAERA